MHKPMFTSKQDVCFGSKRENLSKKGGCLCECSGSDCLLIVLVSRVMAVDTVIDWATTRLMKVMVQYGNLQPHVYGDQGWD